MSAAQRGEVGSGLGLDGLTQGHEIVVATDSPLLSFCEDNFKNLFGAFSIKFLAASCVLN